MPTVFEIPLTPQPQNFKIDLVGTTYNMTVVWNDNANTWELNIADFAGVPIINGLALVTGCDLLEQFGYLNFGGSLVVQTDHDPDTPPTFDNLGVAGRLFFYVA